ncbi:hypothetical protein IEU95_04485 [Hoyosella rhizosphaerae]|uniref:Uncharacterized protein n=1 Tax=Hoyosella rhizosphaerae TaxID=1755582 RepID=A0A916XDF2_9ACTN|nr:hypothetical protein [Hoyosella rhizosphaerae]MBN4926073.1 hypothetical protein [Hoyosella rhizosphaerae]GGC65775.1 hypothetical protein GCM10011410_17880 [Hoyosella rhizosphaerae]
MSGLRGAIRTESTPDLHSDLTARGRVNEATCRMAQRVVASRSISSDDCRELLAMLGLDDVSQFPAELLDDTVDLADTVDLPL